MSVEFKPQTLELIESRMKEFGFESADELIETALGGLAARRGVDYEDLDEETRAAIEEGEAQYQRGEWRPIEDVRDELMRRFKAPPVERP